MSGGLWKTTPGRFIGWVFVILTFFGTINPIPVTAVVGKQVVAMDEYRCTWGKGGFNSLPVTWRQPLLRQPMFGVFLNPTAQTPMSYDTRLIGAGVEPTWRGE